MSIIRRLARYEDPNSLGSRLRQRRSVHIRELIDVVFHERGSCSILDVGGTEKYWGIFGRDYLASRNVHITLLNLIPTEVKGERFTTVAGDGCRMPEFSNGQFDLVHSNSVIEHVGNWDRVQSFANEIIRVGRYYYVQTPYYWFILEPHYGFPGYQWLPRPIRIGMLLRHTLGQIGRQPDVGAATLAVESIRLLDRRQFRFLFPNAEIRRERLALMTKSLMAVGRPRAAASPG